MSELIYGIHAVQILLNSNPDRFLYIYISKGSLNKRLRLLCQQSKQFNIPVQYCDRVFLNKKVKCAAHQGVVAEINTRCSFQEKDMLCLLQARNRKDLLLLILDSVTDPRNMGACLRCAVAFGVDLVIVPRHRSVGLTAVVRKVSAGLADSVPFVRVVNLARTLILLQKYNVWIVGTVLASKKSIFQANLAVRLGLVMGSEGIGIRCSTKKYCDELVNIPMVSELTSLNVSVATGICLFEILRQRAYM
ncbi:23S rRNA (guanosine(2251)-2'-O)-methyltransferase RlmB [Blochmannia endosymbiont of Polyrhachis (Hedomyrma) turneri]|uniref:23S rRNA (guanosine(2251)-2'-O)-methyltransferase RlmB n=1 Tax=Blochmannia endosymbiont of Polyrhachis (Hedomyrma) turneri TaxID=1505596 RepID=UPI00061A89A0|nr:23S rRNA (guanosine(2251)-2'-O)-methyltransferase RlmB [Blochmannia endosymbiont of Polyrhachis (Hedomyrma) turneri]AKC59670.1 23S rRNA (guanosine-2'-O-)-methyltransferase RlmB [Blochmannia endosymbiont of Polyrhachis (Hedomyrma) turneri]